jgi:hypothetical protein
MLKSFDQFVNEARREGIFRGDLNKGASPAFIERSKETTAYKVLKFIYDSGENGRRYTDIVKFIVEDLRGGEYTRDKRGYWGTNLVHYNRFNRERLPLLYTYAMKNSEGRWVLKPQTKEFFDLQEFGDLDLSAGSIDLLAKIAASDL